MNISERIKMAREYAKLSQAELATLAGLKQQQISQLENGEVKSTAKINRIALACKVNPFWLSDEIGEMVDWGALTDAERNHLILLRAASQKTKDAVQNTLEIEQQSRDLTQKLSELERKAG